MNHWISAFINISDKKALLKYMFNVLLNKKYPENAFNREYYMRGPNEIKFIGEPNSSYELWACYADYDKKVFDKLKELNFNVFFDIGANLGQYSLALNAINNIDITFAFEPNSRNFNTLCKNITNNSQLLKNSNIKVIKKAVSNENSTVKMYENEMRGSHSICNQHKTDRFEDVDTVKIDSLDLNIPKNSKILIKLDIEGSEINALKGMENFITKYKPTFIIEIFENENNLANFFKQHNYKLTDIDGTNFLAEYGDKK
jgi:FkbM family methyltransferase